MLRLNEAPVRKILRNVGTTDKEIEIYIFLAKHGPLKGAEIAQQTDTDKAEIYRILKSLQRKGLLESTLESPTRFAPVPFGKVLDSFIKARRDEVSSIENAKEDLLSDWDKISKTVLETSVEKFVIIEGENKINARIFQLVQEAKYQLSAVSSVSGLLLGDRFGVFKALNELELKSNVKVRFVTDLPEKDTGIMRKLFRRIPKGGYSFKWRVPDLGLKLHPPMLIKDQEEILLFITPKKEVSRGNDDEVCLWTNCSTIVQSFIRVFTDLWNDSTELEKKIIEVETGKPSPKTQVIKDAEIARRLYEQIAEAAKEEIVILTSSEGLLTFSKNIELSEDWAKNGVKVRIMAPILGESSTVALENSKKFEVRHVPAVYLTTTVVDGRHLFQFRNPLVGTETSATLPIFENTFYTSDLDYVEKTKAMLDSMWKNSQVPSSVSVESVLHPPDQAIDFPVDEPRCEYRKDWNVSSLKCGQLTEKDVINKIMHADEKPPRHSYSKHVDVFYGSSAIAVIRPPDCFKLPQMVIQVGRFDKSSSFGGHDEITISSWLDTGKGFGYVPVAQICDNSKVLAHRKRIFAGLPIAQNLQFVKKQELQVQVHGNTLFAGWTVPIRLFPPPSILPPCCMLFEGFGELRTKVMETKQFGRRQVFESNTYDAFVTFDQPQSKYSAPGTDGMFSRDIVVTTYPLEFDN